MPVRNLPGLALASAVGLVFGCSGGSGTRGDGGAGDGTGAGGGGGVGGAAGGGSGGAGARDGSQPSGPSGPFTGEHDDPSFPPGAKDGFGGSPSSNPMAKPRLVYPLGGAMLGRNIGGMNIQWSAGDGNKAFRVRIEGAAVNAKLFAGEAACPGGKCRVPVPDQFWLGVASAAAGAKVKLTVDGVPQPGAGGTATSEPIEVSFSPEPLRGGLYYWSTKLQGIMRVRLGETTPEPFLAKSNAQGKCIGCHVVSRDGCRVAFTFEGCSKGSLGVVDVVDPSKQMVPAGQETSTLPAWNPDGSRLVTVFKGALTLRDRLGAPVTAVPREHVGPAGNNDATHPEWSPDGRWIIFTRQSLGSSTGTSQPFSDCANAGDIMLMPYTDAGVSPASVLVAGSDKEYHFYPHFSPDSRWVVFNTGKRPGRSPFGMHSSYDQTTARLQLVSVEGGPPRELTLATSQMDRTASWPKFSPFAQRQGSLLFVVFSTRIDYGWLLEQSTIKPVSPGLFGRPQLWVAAIDTSKADGDPSFAPFWLPFQVPTEGNHLGYWTTKIVGATAGGADCR